MLHRSQEVCTFGLAWFVGFWVHQDRLNTIQRLRNADLQFGDFVEVVLFGGEVETGHGGSFLLLEFPLVPAIVPALQ